MDQELVDRLDVLTARARALVQSGGRRLLGITGSPGAGKTTLAIALAEALNSADLISGSGTGAPVAAQLPMDGFHLANATLDRLGRHGRKGAVDTFDGWGFVGLLERIRAELDHAVYAPSFRRTVDEPIAGEIEVPAGVPLVIVEGNYLLVDDPPWDQIRGLLDEVWFCVTPAEARLARLVDRHTRHGRTPEAAAAWATEVDGRNAALIESTRSRADLLVSGTELSGSRPAAGS